LHAELETSLATSHDELTSLKSDLEKQKVLNEKLEADILSMNKPLVNGDSTAESLDIHPGLEAIQKVIYYASLLPTFLS
jgi:homeobox protein cut-like